ncbi:MAG: 4-phosphoerythronate dehydrogenase [Bacteroidales bacterium]|nr:4-phosphoerythronate dehydrogenase [Bacteroidales bacterium]
MKIVADDKIPYLKGILEPYADIVYLPANNITNKKIADADALIIRSITICDSELLDNTNIRFIASATIGNDHIDKEYCKLKNISWENAQACNSSSVTQYIASALLYIEKHYKFTLSYKTIGIIGVGNIGSKVAGLAKNLGLNVLLNDPPRVRNEGVKGFVSIEQILAESDIISLHVPLNYTGIDKTYHLVNKNFINDIRKKVFLLNSSRGSVVDNKILKLALKSGKLAGAVLDVWENEPDLDIELLDLVNIGTPHIAGYSSEGKANGTSMSVQAISRFFNFGLNEWCPQIISEQKKSVITIDCSGKTDRDILFEAVTATYNIQEDDNRLRNSPETFEKQRDNYTLRREFPAYSVELINNTKEILHLLKRLGFKIL